MHAVSHAAEFSPGFGAYEVKGDCMRFGRTSGPQVVSNGREPLGIAADQDKPRPFRGPNPRRCLGNG
jgi:hypothetical protein